MSAMLTHTQEQKSERDQVPRITKRRGTSESQAKGSKMKELTSLCDRFASSLADDGGTVSGHGRPRRREPRAPPPRSPSPRPRKRRRAVIPGLPPRLFVPHLSPCSTASSPQPFESAANSAFAYPLRPDISASEANATGKQEKSSMRELDPDAWRPSHGSASSSTNTFGHETSSLRFSPGVYTRDADGMLQRPIPHAPGDDVTIHANADVQRALGERFGSCPICLSVGEEPSVLEPCRHQFCRDCIFRWADMAASEVPPRPAKCPLCKRTGSYILHSLTSNGAKLSRRTLPRPLPAARVAADEHGLSPREVRVRRVVRAAQATARAFPPRRRVEQLHRGLARADRQPAATTARPGEPAAGHDGGRRGTTTEIFTFLERAQSSFDPSAADERVPGTSQD